MLYPIRRTGRFARSRVVSVQRRASAGFARLETAITQPAKTHRGPIASIRGIVLQAPRQALQPRCMNPITDNAHLTALLSLFVAQLPILIVSVLGCLVVGARRDEFRGATAWALMGFGLSVVLCIVMPVVQTLVQRWVVEGGGSMAQRASVFTILGVAWSVLRATSYGLLLMALVAGVKRNA
jgi:uncharacterized Tic20 family protein